MSSCRTVSMSTGTPGDLPVGADGAADVKPVHVGKVDVQDDDVRRTSLAF